LATCSGTTAGTFTWDSGASKIKMCDGTNWSDMAPPGCGGVTVGGYCWYYGSNGQSCDTVCATHGLYNAATDTYAGSGGTSGNCLAVLNALGAPGSTINVGIGSMGCAVLSGTRLRYNATTSSASDVSVSRACACNN
jgi:hypothetical protein